MNPRNGRLGRVASWSVVAITLIAGAGFAQRSRSFPAGTISAVPPWARTIEQSDATAVAEREIVRFEFRETVVKTTRAIFLVGSLPELAAGDVRRAIRMNTSDRIHWTVSVSLPARGSYSYRFIRRDVQPRNLSKKSNATTVSEMFIGRPEDGSYLPPAKRVQLHTTIREPVLSWRVGAQTFQCAALHRIGPGRFDGEGLFESRFGTSGTTINYFVSSPGGGQREPAVGTYQTPLDVFFLQDGEVFTYVPAKAVGPARRHKPFLKNFTSTILGTRRTYRVMLPRGYWQHVGRRYPVLFLYDGQWVWDMNGAWDPGGTRMASLVGKGFAGEMLIVAIDSPSGCARLFDTVPPDDLLNQSPMACAGRGNANNFLSFIATELKPRIDRVYRTKPDVEHTFLGGFSAGGLLALVAGNDFGHTFGAVAGQSSAHWLAPNFTARLNASPPTDTRFYLDAGDSEFIISADLLDLVDEMSWIKSYVADLAMQVGFGQMHTYQEAGTRMQPMMRFIYPARREVVLLK